MSSMNISIRDDVYRWLRAMKRKDESFSDVIERTAIHAHGNKSARTLLRFAGALKHLDLDWDAKEKRMQTFRNEFNTRIEQTTKYMEEARKKKK